MKDQIIQLIEKLREARELADQVGAVDMVMDLDELIEEAEGEVSRG